MNQNMDYGAISYFLSAGDFNDVDSFFAELDRKIRLLEHHTKTTHKLYERERMTSLDKIKLEYDSLIATAEARYTTALHEIIGDDSVKHSFADHESSLSYLTDKYAAECEASDQHFSGMVQILYTSQIIAIYILLEAELKRLCDAWQKLTGARIMLRDFGYRDYLSASYTYLDKVVGIDKTSLVPFENKLTDLQNLRNRLVHDGGMITTDQLKKVVKLVESSKGGLITRIEGPDSVLVITKVGYVMEWFSVIRAFFEQLYWVIDASMGNRFLINRLQYLFGFINPYISIDITDVIIDKPQREINFIINCTDPTAPFDVEVVLELKNASEQRLKIINKTSGIDQINRFKNFIDSNNHYFWRRSFLGFLLTNNKKAAAIMIK